MAGEFGLEGMSEGAGNACTIDKPFGMPVGPQARMTMLRDRGAH
jgi:hypothetical protein